MEDDIFISVLVDASKEKFRPASHGAVTASRADMDDVQTGLQAAAKHPIVFLISDSSSIRYQFGRLSWHVWGMAGDPRPNILGEEITLTDKSLRRTFTFIEFSVFLLVKNKQFEHDQNYRSETEPFSDRLKRLREYNILVKPEFELLKSIKSTRDQFAHSFVDLENLTYKGQPVYSHRQAFLSDLFEAAKSLENKFIDLQEKQVDWVLFNKVYSALKKARNS